MSWWQDFWRKPSSASGHLAWGYLVASVFHRMDAPDVLRLLAACLAGVAWEVGPELALWIGWKAGLVEKPTLKSWHARAADVPPWFFGGIAQILLWWGV